MRRTRGLCALVVLLAVLVGLPWALAVTVGNPLHAWSALQAGDISDATLVAVLAAVAYVAVLWAWASFALAFTLTLVEAVRARLAHRPARTLHIPGLGGQLDLARAAVTAILLFTPTAAGLAGGAGGHPHPAAQSPATHVTAAVQMPAVQVTPARQSTPSTTPRTTSPVSPATAARSAPVSPAGAGSIGASPAAAGEERSATAQTYRIPEQGGLRTYWAMAEHFYGDPYLWPRIWQANQGRTQIDGSVMDSANLLRRGWTVLIPAATGPAPAPASPTPASASVTVQPGDYLFKIAREHQVSEPALWAANKDRTEPDGRVFTDPNLILPGWRLRLPDTAGQTTRPAPGPAAVPPGHTTVPAPAPPRRPPHRADPPATRPTPPPPAPARSRPHAPASAVPAPPAPARADTPAAGSPGAPAGFPIWAELASALGGGVLLWAGAARALQVRRRRQFREMRIGHTVEATPPQAVAAEKAAMRYGPVGAAEKRFLDHALRSLTRGAGGDRGLPAVAAARLSGGQLALRLAEPHPAAPPPPWRADASGMWWTVEATDPLPVDDATRDEQLAPYPTLAAIGYQPAVDGGTSGSERWLLDLEQAGSIALSGDRDRCLDLGRFLAADLALNWHADHLRVSMVGFGGELVACNPARLRYYADLAEAARQVAADLAHADTAAGNAEVSVLQGRARDVDADSFMPHVLLIGPDAATDTVELFDLLAALRAHGDRTPVAVVLAGDRPETGTARTRVQLDETGRLAIPALDLRLTGQALPAAEAAAVAAMLTHAETTGQRRMPADTGKRPAARFADVAGGLRPDLTLPRHPDPPPVTDVTDNPSPPAVPGGAETRTLLPAADEEYLRAAATTVEDLADAGRRVPAAVTEQVLAADPRLDEEYAWWRLPDGQCPLPRLTLLGPVRLRVAGGGEVAPVRLPFFAELAAFIATRDHGATAEQIAAAFGYVKPASARSRVNELRTLLGNNPRTGRLHVTEARTSPANQARGGVGVYEIEDLLVDLDLFRRLRTRGEALGAEHGGLDDLEQALSLVTGTPFDHLRLGGWEWLVDDPLHHWLSVAIPSVEHALNDELLRRGEYDRAETAAVIALKAAPYEARPQLDLAAVLEARTSPAAAEAHVRDAVCNYDDDGLGPREVSDRTRTVLRTRNWLAGTGP